MRWNPPLIALVFALASCSGDDASTDGTSSTSATTTATTGGSTGGSTTAGSDSDSTGSDSDSDSTSTSTATSTSSTTDETTTGETTTGTTTGGSGSVMAGCVAYCDTGLACTEEPVTPEECLESCLEAYDFPDGGPECTETSIAYLDCMAGLSCDELDGGADACLDLLGAVIDICDPVQCNGSAEKGAEECSFQLDCTDGTVKTMSCDADGCVCLIDGVTTDACPNDICSEDVDLFALAEKAESCCSF